MNPPELKDSAVLSYPINPEVMIAGSLPYLGSLDIVWQNLCDTLETSNVRFLHQIFGGTVFFIGARDADFEGFGSYISRLASGFPGNKNFIGDGAYLDASGAIAAVLYVEGLNIRAQSGSREDLEREAKNKNLAVVELDETHASRWESVVGLSYKASKKQLKKGTWFGIGAFLVGIVVCFSALSVISIANYRDQAGKLASQQLKVKLNSELTTIAANPLTDQIHKLQLVQSVALKNNGTVSYWKLDANGVAFQLKLPEYVRAEDYKSLEPLNTVENIGGQLVITRGVNK